MIHPCTLEMFLYEQKVIFSMQKDYNKIFDKTMFIKKVTFCSYHISIFKTTVNNTLVNLINWYNNYNIKLWDEVQLTYSAYYWTNDEKHLNIKSSLMSEVYLIFFITRAFIWFIWHDTCHWKLIGTFFSFYKSFDCPWIDNLIETEFIK